MGKTHDLIGFRAGKLVVIQKAGVRNRQTHWLCSCICGGQTTASTNDLRRGHTKSCGCLRFDFRPKLEPTAAVDPSVKFLFKTMNANEISQRELCRRAGLTEELVMKWRRGRRLPSVPDMRAAMGALGYKLKWVEDV